MNYTFKYVETALRGIAAEHPDQINPVNSRGDCVYERNGRHCLVGQFFSNEGVDDEYLSDLDNDRNGVNAGDAFTRLGLETNDDSVLTLLGLSQGQADAGRTPWKNAITVTSILIRRGFI